MKDLDTAITRWKEAGPVPDDSSRLLVKLREAGLTDQPQDLLWAAFVRSLSDEQREAALALLEIVDNGEGFTWF